MHMLEVVLPHEEGLREADPHVFRNFLHSLSLVSVSFWKSLFVAPPRFAFEILVEEGTIRFLVGTQQPYVSYLKQQLYAHYPDADIRYGMHVRLSVPGHTVRIGVLMPRRFHSTQHLRQTDVLMALLRALKGVPRRCTASVRYTFRSGGKGNFFSRIRVAVSGRNRDEIDMLFQNILKAYRGYEAVHKSTVAPEFLLSAAQCALLFRIPHGLSHTSHRSARFAGLPTAGTLLGYAMRQGESVPLYLTDSDRRRHVYCVGNTGTGRRVLLLHMMMQDVQAGKKVVVVDTSGELVEEARHRLFGSLRGGEHIYGYRTREEVADLLARPDALRDSALYFDAFHDFIPGSGEDVLSLADTYAVSLVASDRAIPKAAAASVLGAIGTIVCYAVEQEDAAAMRPLIAPRFTDQDVMGLPKFDAIVRAYSGGSLREACAMETARNGV